MAASSDPSFRGGPREGLFIDNATGNVLLNWPRSVARFPYSAAWIELRRGEAIVGQGVMIVRPNAAATHYVGTDDSPTLELGQVKLKGSIRKPRPFGMKTWR